MITALKWFLLVVIWVCVFESSSALEKSDTPIRPIPTKCPPIGTGGATVNLQHKTNCNKFYTCSNGKKIEMRCPPKLEFNALLQICDYPYRANCSKSNKCPPTGPNDRTILLPYETDCTKFYKCDNGKKVPFNCPAGLFFNSQLEVCDYVCV